jgi:hypothetical protein
MKVSQAFKEQAQFFGPVPRLGYLKAQQTADE